MDLFDYAQALFNQQGNLWVPALGHFFKVRDSSYYDAETNIMHPPVYRIGFEEDLNNTDTAFISYFSTSKNLSQGSAKYFVDKFVENIKEDLQQREVTFASLGTLYTDKNSKIALRGNILDASGQGNLFGLAPVDLARLPVAVNVPEEETPVPDSIDPPDETTAATVPNEEISTVPENATRDEDGSTQQDAENDQPKRAYDPNNFYTDDRVLVLKGKPKHVEKSTRYQFWVLAALVAIVVILGIYLVTQNLLDPANSSDVSSQIMDKSRHKDTAIDLSKAKADSELVHSQDIKTLPAAIDTSSLDDPLGTAANNAKSNTPDPNAKLSPEIPKGSWVISGGQNNNYNAATTVLNRYRSQGYPEARMIDSVKKNEYFVYKIIFGYYSTRKEAAEARSLLLKENKLKPNALKVQQYK